VEVSEKNAQLETLASKLAKYLSPQVYASIFASNQNVQLASQRKKLTVFFSDIVNFTETTDKMESEDLTHLLNHYLTEMSAIALDYGATIDKYIGDAIMIFFGDPESQGVNQDAIACVKMAVAMRKRVEELASEWREAGIEWLPREPATVSRNCRRSGPGDEAGTCLAPVANPASRLQRRRSPSRAPRPSSEGWQGSQDPAIQTDERVQSQFTLLSFAAVVGRG
jgi:class 3 adenylate cyclase